MNSLKMNEVIYKFQDLVIKKELTSYEKFKTHFQSEIKFDKKLRNHRFINDMFKKIYTFLKILQKNSKSIILAQALKPMFEMLLNDMIIPEFVSVFDFDNAVLYYNIDLTKDQNYKIRCGKKIVQVEYNLFINYGRKLEWYDEMTRGRMQDGMYDWLRDRKTKQIKDVGLKIYIEEMEKKYKEQNEEFEGLQDYKCYFDEVCDQKEYDDYYKTTEVYLNKALAKISEIENEEKMYEEFEKKFEKYNY